MQLQHNESDSIKAAETPYAVRGFVILPFDVHLWHNQLVQVQPGQLHTMAEPPSSCLWPSVPPATSHLPNPCSYLEDNCRGQLLHSLQLFVGPGRGAACPQTRDRSPALAPRGRTPAWRRAGDRPPPASQLRSRPPGVPGPGRPPLPAPSPPTPAGLGPFSRAGEAVPRPGPAGPHLASKRLTGTTPRPARRWRQRGWSGRAQPGPSRPPGPPAPREPPSSRAHTGYRRL